MTRAADTVVLAAGGTGGHIFPAQALAEELDTRGIAPVLITDTRFKQYAGAFEAFDIRTICAGNLAGNPLRKAIGVCHLLRGIWQARGILKQLQPRAVAGFGGYPSFPTVVAATQLGIPTLIHEQNAVLGRTNRRLAGRVDAIATSFAGTQGIAPSHASKVTLTGNPVRASVRALRDIPYPRLSDDGMLRLLVIGGSQGAHVFAEVVPAAIAALSETLRARIRIDQQCRAEDLETVRAAYKKLGIHADLAPFLTDIPARLASAHLVITRAGASSVSELMAANRPALLIPLPTAMDDHQTANARAVEATGLGWLVPQPEFTSESLAAHLENFLKHPERLTQAVNSSPHREIPDAAATLAERVLGLTSA